jgi:hypothetical protein
MTAADRIFSALGRTEFIDEDPKTPATALCAYGIAFSLRAYPRGVAGRRSGRFLP